MADYKASTCWKFAHMKRLFFLPLLVLIASCIKEPIELSEDLQPTDPDIAQTAFPAFNFDSAKTIELEINDPNPDPAKYKLYYQLNGTERLLGAVIRQGEMTSAPLTLPVAYEQLMLKKTTVDNETLFELNNTGNTERFDIPLEESLSSTSEGGCIDHLYAVNNNGHFFTIDVTNDDYEPTFLSNLQGGGSIANALDQENGILYYNVGKTLYAYDIDAESFSVKHSSNPFNGNYPRLEYKDGFFYMSNGSTMYKVNAETNAVIAQYNVSGFVNSTSGGDLAFDSNGVLYLACFSGLYKFTDIDDNNGTAQITRISAENFPFQLTSMAIDRQDRIFVGTNDANSNLIQISKEDGAYTIVRTFDRKINDLTAWKCEASELVQIDSDNDGVIDELDDYPNDPDAATDVYTPSALGQGSFAYEDLWPQKGDYDFNDMVIGYRYINVLNSANESVRLKMNFTIRAVGASAHSGFGIELDVAPNLIESVTGHSTLGNNTSLNAQGLEQNQSKAVVIVFNDSFNHISPVNGDQFINTDPAEGTVAPVSFELVIAFTEPIDMNAIGAAPFNPFIFSSFDRSKEVHLAGEAPTSLADPSFFGTGSDDTEPGTGKTYQDENNLPWAIHIIHEFRYPIEKSRIDQGYNKFIDWGLSEGNLFSDWYGDNNGYRNTSRLYFGN